MYMKFTVNLAFWEMFKKRSPNSASNIQPQYTEEVQIFSVDLHEPQTEKLDQPIDLENFMKTMGTDGQRIPTPEKREREENGKIVDMEEQVPELVENNENDDSSESGGQQSQPLITFGQVQLNNMGDTTENLGQSTNVTFAVDNENSRNTPPNPHVLLRDVSQE